VACGLTSGGAAGCPHGLASPDHAGVALAAQPVGLLGDRTAGTLTTSVLGEYGDEVMHRNPFSLGAVVGPLWPGDVGVVRIAECIGEPRRNHRAAGRALDVTGRPG
jgi:hypothetical protein